MKDPRLQYKELISQKPNVVEINSINRNSYGYISIQSDENQIPCYVVPPIELTDHSRIFVFFSAIGIYRNESIAFHRISWSNYINDCCIFLDDPTRVLSHFAPTFFLGYTNNRLIKDITDIVKKYCEIWKIPSSGIYLIGSSNGGFAAIKATQFFNDANCIALCPQFSIPLYLKNNFSKLEDHLKRKIAEDEKNNFPEIFANNNKNRFYIYSNLADIRDRQQVEKLSDYLGIKIADGYYHPIDNVYLYIVNIKASDPHLVQPDYFEILWLLDISKNSNKKKHSSLFNVVVNNLSNKFLEGTLEQNRNFDKFHQQAVKENVILSWGKSLNPIRFLIEGYQKYNFIGAVKEHSNQNIIEFGLQNIERKKLLPICNETASRIISFKAGDELIEEIKNMRVCNSLIPQSYIPVEYENPSILGFENLFKYFSIDEIGKLFLYWKYKGKKTVLINGNCQTFLISQLLSISSCFAKRYVIIDIPRICDAKSEQIPNLEKLIRMVDLIITQPIKDDNKFTCSLSTNNLIRSKRKDARVITIPNLTFLGYFPQQGQYKTVSAPISLGNKELFAYRDSFIEALFEKGFSLEQIYSKVMDPFLWDSIDICNYFDEQYKISLEREANLDIRFFDKFYDTLKSNVCFYSFNHPREWLVVKLTNMILKFLHLPEEHFDLTDLPYRMNQQTQIIYPCVLKALNIYSNCDEKAYINKQSWQKKFTVPEYIVNYYNSLILSKK